MDTSFRLYLEVAHAPFLLEQGARRGCVRLLGASYRPCLSTWPWLGGILC